MEYNWKYFIVLNNEKYGLNNIVEDAPRGDDGLLLCQDFSVAINFESPESLVEWVRKYTNLVLENGDYHIEGHYLPGDCLIVEKKYRYKVEMRGEECMEGYISLTPKEAKIVSYATNFNNWDISEYGCYTGRFVIHANEPYCSVSVKYRPHKGSLEDSMKETKEFKSIEEMFAYISESYNGLILPDDIIISDKPFIDNRIDWKETRYVCIKRFDGDGYDVPQCIGMCCIENVDEI